MNIRVVVDASVWVSRLMPPEINHNASSFWVERFTAEGGLLAAPSFLLIEVAAGVSRQTRQPSVSKKALEDLNNANVIQFISMDEVLTQAAIDVAINLQLRAGDAIYVALARQLNIPLISWDKEQLPKASTIITTYTPATYVFPQSESEEPTQQ